MRGALVNMASSGLSGAILYSELASIYRRLEKELMPINPDCCMCGTCCNFNTFDHILYSSSIEAGFITQHVKIPDFDVSNNICPFLKDNQCSIRDYRMLGCRIFYCNAAYQEIAHVLYEKYLQEIKELSKRHSIPWEYLPFLNSLAKLKLK